MTKFKTAVFYGFVVALSGALLMLLLIALKLLGPRAITLGTEMAGGTILFLMLYLFLLVGVYYVIKKRKETINHQITFKEAVFQGVILSLTTAICSVFFTVIFYELLYPNYVNETVEALQLKMQDIGVPTDRLSAKIEDKKTYYSTSSQSLFSFVGNFITGIAFTLLLSFFLKSNGRK